MTIPEGGGSLFGRLLGGAASNDSVHQIFMWGILYGLISSVFRPELAEIEKGVWNFGVDSGASAPIPPADLADWVVRNIEDKDTAAGAAKGSGVKPSDFERMVQGAGEPPGLQQIMEWYRRGIIEWGSGKPGDAGVLTAIRTGRIYDYWADAIRGGTLEPPSPADAVDAVLRNQISQDEGIALAFFGGLGVRELAVPEGRDIADTERAFRVLVDTAGNPPSLTELLELARRKIIPWGNLDPATKSAGPGEISFAQGIFEGNTKDKWLPYYAKLGVYLPPPRTIVTLLRNGVITTEQAQTLFEESGLQPDLAQAYVNSAHSEKVAAHKNLALAEIETLYYEHTIDEATAAELIGKLGYDAQEITFILATVDMRRALAALNGAVNRVQSYYVAHKVDQTTARSMLARLGVPDAQVTAMLESWTVARESNVRLLSEAQIVDAWEYKVMDQATAMSELEGIGYTPFDAWVLLSNKARAPLPNPPPRGPAEVT